MDHKDYMARALELAAQAAEHGDVPVGCVIVKDGKIVGEGRNRREEHGDATAHAELEAIRDACARLGSWRLHRVYPVRHSGALPPCAPEASSTPALRRCATAPGMKRRGAARRCSTCLRSALTTTPGSIGDLWSPSVRRSSRTFSWTCGRMGKTEWGKIGFPPRI